MKNKSVQELMSDIRKYQDKIDNAITLIETKTNRGWCDECGEDFDLKPEWKYNTHCGECGHPIPPKKILYKPRRGRKPQSPIKKLVKWFNDLY